MLTRWQNSLTDIPTVPVCREVFTKRMFGTTLPCAMVIARRMRRGSKSANASRPGKEARAHRQAAWWVEQHSLGWERRAAHDTPRTIPITRVQSALRELGYGPGPIDGVLGEQTSRAIRQYQRDHALAVDGRVSIDLANHLDARVSNSASPNAVERIAALRPTSDVELVQQALSLLGFAPGAIDGRLGPRTAAAIREYQVRHRLPVDGELSVQLMDHLREQLLSRSASRITYQN